MMKQVHWWTNNNDCKSEQ